MSNQWDYVVETLEDSDCDDLDIEMIFESKIISSELLFHSSTVRYNNQK